MEITVVLLSFSLQLLQDQDGLQLILESPKLFLPQIYILNCFSLELNKKAKFSRISAQVILVLF